MKFLSFLYDLFTIPIATTSRRIGQIPRAKFRGIARGDHLRREHLEIFPKGAYGVVRRAC